MPGRAFRKLLSASHAHPVRLVAVVAALLAASGAVLSFADFDSDLTTMLPNNDRLKRGVRFLRTSQLSESVLVSLGLTSPDRGIDDLKIAADEFAPSLDSPLIKRVDYRFTGSLSFDELARLSAYLPQFFTEEARADVEARITPDGIRKMLRGHYKQLVSPASSVTSGLMRVDPFGLLWTTLQAAKENILSSGHNVELKDGYFISPDERHALVLIQSAASVTDVHGSRELLTFLESRIAALPPYVSCDLVAGHRHTISNEDIIKKDIRVLSVVGLICFPLLLLVGFRDLRSVLVFVIPVLAMVMALAITSLLFDTLALFILGMSVVMLGITVDYGIHVFSAIRSTSDPLRGVADVAKPAAVGAATTVAVFVAFIITGVPAYRQFAVFASLTIFFSLALALLLMPAMYRTAAAAPDATAPPARAAPLSRGRAGIVIAVWSVVVIAGLAISTGLRIGSNMARYDGTAQEVLDEETRFHRAFGGDESIGIIVSEDEDLERAMETIETVIRNVEAETGPANISSITAIWPSKKVRRDNATRWAEFWNAERRRRLAALLREQGDAFGFAADTFDPFLAIIDAPPSVGGPPEDSQTFKELFRRFVMRTAAGYQVLAFFKDADPNFPVIQRYCREQRGVHLVSRQEFNSLLHETFASGILVLVAIIGVSIPVLTFAFFRNLLLSLVALVPVVTGVLAVCASCVVGGIMLDGAISCGSLIVVGLCIDYGVFYVHHCRGTRSVGTPVAVSLSALTTVIGAVVLLTAEHPVLFPFGFVLVCGMPAGYLAAVTVVPALIGIVEQRGRPKPQ